MSTADHPTLDIQKKFWNDKWDQSRNQYPHDRARRRGDKILAYLRSIGRERPTILDLGCGTGWFTNQLAELGPSTGLDLSVEAIAQAKSQFPQVAFQAGNLFEMALSERQFDVIVSQEVLAHVADQSGYLERAALMLKPGGHLIVTTPNPFIHERCEWPVLPPGHIEQWLTPRALKHLLRPHFRVLRRTTAVPLGHRGFLRLVNSPKLNGVLGTLLSKGRIEAFKEWAGFGWTQIVLAQKRS
jgi:2-polyprenyl-3-methyl-5-hydroxy-6-metoxy-1,4-benzoquinol methylase